MKRAELSIEKGNECRLTQRCKNETLHEKKWNTASKAPRADGSSCSWTEHRDWNVQTFDQNSDLAVFTDFLVEVESSWTALNWSPIFKALPILRQETNSASKIVPKMKNLMVILIFIVNDFESMSKFPAHNTGNSNWHVDLLVIYANTLTVIFKQIETT